MGDDPEESDDGPGQGDSVRVIDGPFKNFSGTVQGVDIERSTVRVDILFFDRRAPVELGFEQIRRV